MLGLCVAVLSTHKNVMLGQCVAVLCTHTKTSSRFLVNSLQLNAYNSADIIHACG